MPLCGAVELTVFIALLTVFRRLLFLSKMPVEQMQYSEKYYDDFYEYRHVILPPELAALVPRNHLMTETEWRNLGVQQSPNWVHYMIHNPEPHVLLFRRPKSLDASIEINEIEAHASTVTAV